MKKSMRAFGIGLFLAGAVIAGYDQFFADKQTADTKELEQQIKQYEQQIEQLTAQLPKQEPENNENTTNQDSEPATDEKQSTNKQQDTVITEATIYIYEDVSIYTIGQQAEDLGIVSNGRELELFLAKPEYARSIQKGAFDLRSDMTIDEIAKIITGKKLD